MPRLIMRSRRARLLAALATASLLAASAMGTAAVSADESATIFDARTPAALGYRPGVIRTQPGTWVTWSNTGADAHTVTARDGSFDSGDLLPSEGFSWYFDAPGTYEYFCTLHAWMRGRVVVGSGAAPAPALDPTAAPPPVADPAPADESMLPGGNLPAPNPMDLPAAEA